MESSAITRSFGSELILKQRVYYKHRRTPSRRMISTTKDLSPKTKRNHKKKELRSCRKLLLLHFTIFTVHNSQPSLIVKHPFSPQNKLQLRFHRLLILRTSPHRTPPFRGIPFFCKQMFGQCVILHILPDSLCAIIFLSDHIYLV